MQAPELPISVKLYRSRMWIKEAGVKGVALKALEIFAFLLGFFGPIALVMMVFGETRFHSAFAMQWLAAAGVAALSWWYWRLLIELTRQRPK